MDGEGHREAELSGDKGNAYLQGRFQHQRTLKARLGHNIETLARQGLLHVDRRGNRGMPQSDTRKLQAREQFLSRAKCLAFRPLGLVSCRSFPVWGLTCRTVRRKAEPNVAGSRSAGGCGQHPSARGVGLPGRAGRVCLHGGRI